MISPSQAPSPGDGKLAVRAGDGGWREAAPSPRVSSGDPTGRHDRSLWLALAVLLGLVLPPLVLLHSLGTLRQAARDRAVEAVADRLEEDLQLAERGFDPWQQTAARIRRFLIPALSRIGAAPEPRLAMAREARSLLRHLARTIPGFTGFCLAHDPPPDRAPLKPETGSGTRLLFTVGAPQPVTRLEVERLFTVLKKYLYGDPSLSLPMDAWRKSRLGPAWGLFREQRFSKVALPSCGTFLPASLHGNPRLFLWEPILAGASSPAGVSGSGRTPEELYLAVRQRLLGGLLIVVDAQALLEREIEVTARTLLGNLARTGCRFALIRKDGEGEGQGWRHPDFLHDHELGQAAAQTASGVRVVGGWIVLEGHLEREDKFRVLVARPVETEGGGLSAWEIAGRAAIAWWFCLGLAVWGQVVVLGRDISLSIRRQLILAFSFVLFPALGFGIVILEKHLLEKHTRFESDLKSWMAKRLEAFDGGLQLYQSWGCRFLFEMVRNPGFLEQVRKIEAEGEVKGGSGPEPFLFALHCEAYRRGIHVRNLLLTGPGKFQLRFYPFEGGRESRNTNAENLGNFFRVLFQDTLSRIRGSSRAGAGGSSSTGDQAGEIVSGAKVEMVLSMVRALFPPEMLTEICLAPTGFHDVGEGSITSIFFHHFLGYPELPSYILQADLMPSLFERGHLSEWFFSPEEPGWGKLDILLSIPESPRFFQEFPYMEPGIHPGYWDFDRVISLHPPAAADLTLRAAMVGGPCWERFGEGDTEEVAVAWPARAFQDRILYATMPLGRFVAESRTFAGKVRGILFCLFWFNLALAILVAGRIEAPVARLRAAALRVMRGDFTEGIAETRADEFGQLAQAFNRMLELVGQGRLLESFVGDSARVTVRAAVGGRLDAGTPVALEAVILFVGPRGFKQRLHEVPPQEVVADLNLLLETISRVVRSHHGEINKFIGEKVLAVFPVTGPAGRPRAAAEAVAAAEELRTRVRSLAPWRDTAIGVGLVHGPALSGVLGTDQVRLECTVIGDTVNLASRLCDLALGEAAGGIILDSGLEAELRRLGSTQLLERTRRLPDLKVKGKSRTVEAFRLIASDW